jgi:hypothetical protein
MEGKLYLEILIRWAIATAILYVMQRILDYFNKKKENFEEEKPKKKVKAKGKKKVKKVKKNTQK